MKHIGFVCWFVVIAAIFKAEHTFAQTPVLLSVDQDTVVICNGNSATIIANVQGAGNCNLGTVISDAYGAFLSDDQFYDQIVDIGFNFTFYGNTYNQLLISTNNYLSFDLTNNTAGGYSPWSIGNAIPDATATNTMNAIMGPWQDILPSTAPAPPSLGIIKYAIVGTAPNRIFVLDYNTVTMFSCTTQDFTSQIQLYETSNNIETHITNKPICSTWNSGQAIHGLHNANGTIAHVVPGRNAGSQWTANNEGYRFSPTSPTNYTIAPIPFNPSPITNGLGVIQWYEGNNLMPPGDTLVASPAVTTTYTARFFDGCTGTTYTQDAIVIVTNTALTSFADSVDCNGDNNGFAWMVPTGDFAPYSINWQSSIGTQLSQHFGVTAADTLKNLIAGTYIVTVSDSANCVSKDTIVVLEPDVLETTIIPTDNLCFGERNGSAVATITGGTTPYTYIWNDPYNQNTLTADSLYAGNYLFNVTDFHDCFLSTNVIVAQPPKLELVTSSVTDTCEKSLGVAKVNVNGGTPFYSYYWLPDSTDHQIATNIPSGDHYAIVTDANNCRDTALAVVQNIASPIADFSFLTADDGVLYPEVIFGNKSEYSTTYRWNFGDGGATSDEYNPVHLFPSADSFLVSLISFNQFDCSDTIAQRIKFPPYYTFYVPNGFTPNNDGINDVFTPVSLDSEPESYSMSIYNRWGQEVFRSKDFTNPWDGKDRSGNLLGPGVYAYAVVISEWTGFVKKYQGKITIAK